MGNNFNSLRHRRSEQEQRGPCQGYHSDGLTGAVDFGSSSVGTVTSVVITAKNAHWGFVLLKMRSLGWLVKPVVTRIVKLYNILGF